jgi:hypothetical protein
MDVCVSSPNHFHTTSTINTYVRKVLMTSTLAGDMCGTTVRAVVSVLAGVASAGEAAEVGEAAASSDPEVASVSSEIGEEESTGELSESEFEGEEGEADASVVIL